MKKVVFLAFMLLNFAFAMQSDRQKMELRGNVKSMTSVHKDYNQAGKVTAEATEKIAFNNGGNILKSELFVGKNLQETKTYEYDEKNRPIKGKEGDESFTYSYNQTPNGLEQTKIGDTKMIYLYDKNGILLSEKSLGAQGFSFHRSYIYNERGDILEIKDHVSPQNSVKYSYEYNGDIKVAQNGKVHDKKWRNEYDKNGFEVRNFYESGLGTKQNLRLESEFDEKGNVIDVKFYDKKGKMTRHIQNSYEYFK